MKITLLIPTYNVEDCLERCLSSAADLADEILVVDSYSTDHSLEIARRFGARILQRDYENSAAQKNWAIPQASHSWILLLDADEWLSPSLHAEIHRLKSAKEEPVEIGFWIYRANHFMGRRIRYSGWQKDKVIRFFQRDFCRYESKKVHAEITTTGNVGRLASRLFHNTYKDKTSHENKLRRYAQWQAQDYDLRTGRITVVHTHLKPAWRFFRHYFLQLGLLDGYPGFFVAYYGYFAVRERYRALKDFRQSSH